MAVGAALLSFLAQHDRLLPAVGIEHFGEHPFDSSIPWLATGNTTLNIGVLIDPLSAITLFFVAWTVLMIFIYSDWLP